MLNYLIGLTTTNRHSLVALTERSFCDVINKSRPSTSQLHQLINSVRQYTDDGNCPKAVLKPDVRSANCFTLLSVSHWTRNRHVMSYCDVIHSQSDAPVWRHYLALLIAYCRRLSTKKCRKLSLFNVVDIREATLEYSDNVFGTSRLSSSTLASI